MKKNAVRFFAPSLAGVTVFYIWAFVLVIRKSFLVSGISGWSGLSNYKDVLMNRVFWMAMKNTVLYMLACISILLISTLFVAWVITEELPIHRVLKTGYLIPLALPASGVIFLWNLFFDVHGFLNGILHYFGLEVQNWMEGKYAMWILVVVYLWKNFGYYVILWSAALSLIPKDTYDAAKVDGANNVQIFFRVTIPQFRTSAYYILLFAVMSGFKIFREAYVAAGEYPNQGIYMIQHLLNNWYREMDIGKLSSAAGVLVLFLSVFTLLIYHGWREKAERRGFCACVKKQTYREGQHKR